MAQRDVADPIVAAVGFGVPPGDAARIADALREQNDGVVVRIQKTAVHHHVFRSDADADPVAAETVVLGQRQIAEIYVGTAVYHDMITVGAQNFYIAHLYVRAVV